MTDPHEQTPPEPAAEQRRPALTLREAAERAGVSRSAVRKRLDRAEFPGAWRDDGRAGPGTGPWRIPVDDLLAAGLDLAAGQREREREQTPPPAPPAPEPAPSAEADRLRAELADMHRRAEVAEALAAERAERIADLRSAVRALGPSEQTPPEQTPEPAQRADGGWWHRWRERRAR